jgi:hypothetical protein
MNTTTYRGTVLAIDPQDHQLRVTVETVIDTTHAEDFYRLYLAAFGPLRSKAVARQVLHLDEFMAEMSDPRVWKYVAWQANGRPVAMATITRSLETVPWISPEYFTSTYPEHASRNAIYYLGFILVHPRHRRSRAMEQLVQAMLAPLERDRAICGFDVCAFNNVSFNFAAHIESMLGRLTPGHMRRVDDQIYYTITFP